MNSFLTSPWGRWSPVVGYAALVFCLSHQPQLPTTPGGDKTAHVIAYAILGFLCARALTSFDRGLRWALATAASTLYGMTDEWHQSFVPGRTASGADLVADGIGAAIGAALFVGGHWIATLLYPGAFSVASGRVLNVNRAARRPSKEAS